MGIKKLVGSGEEINRSLNGSIDGGVRVKTRVAKGAPWGSAAGYAERLSELYPRSCSSVPPRSLRGRPNHRQNARLDGIRQRRPSLDHGSQVGVETAVLCTKCAALCAALGCDR